MKYTAEEVKIANKTSRNKGAVGMNAIVPAYIIKSYDRGTTILDFGAGKAAAHAGVLRNEGFDSVAAHEFGDNVDPDLHDPNALSRKYDLVYASNVLNVQSSVNMLGKTIETLAKAVRKQGVLLVNYPSSPRKGVMEYVDSERLGAFLLEFFIEVDRVGGTRSAPLLRCSGVRR